MEKLPSASVQSVIIRSNLFPCPGQVNESVTVRGSLVSAGSGSIDGAKRLLSAKGLLVRVVAGFACPGVGRSATFGLVPVSVGGVQSAAAVPAPRIRKGGALAEKGSVRRLRRARARIRRKCVSAFGLKVQSRTVTLPLQATKGQCRHRSKSFGRVRLCGPRVARRRSGDFA
mgnify:CR=1 FL=1